MVHAIYSQVCADELFVNVTQARLMWEEEVSLEKLAPSPVGKPVGHSLD